jgi:hypothetical protein
VVELEGTGADRLVLVALRRFRRDDHRVAPAHIVQERALRVLELHLDGRGIRHRHCVDRREKTLLGIGRFFGPRPVEREFHVVGVEFAAIVEFHARMQLEDVDLAVVRHCPALGQGRQHFAAAADTGEPLEDVGINDFVDCGRGTGGRVEMRRLQHHTKHEVGTRGKRRAARQCEARRSENGFPRLRHLALPSLKSGRIKARISQGVNR